MLRRELPGGWHRGRVAAADRVRRPPAGVAGFCVTISTPIGDARLFLEAPCSAEGAQRYAWAFVNHGLATTAAVVAAAAPPWPGVDQRELALGEQAARRLRGLCDAPSRCLHSVPVPAVDDDPYVGEVKDFVTDLGVRLVDQ